MTQKVQSEAVLPAGGAREKKPPTYQRYLASAALLLASVVLAVGLAEVALRLTHYGEGNLIHLEKFVAYDSLLGWRHKRNFSSEFVNDESRTTLRFDANGWRGIDRSYPKPPNVFRIVVLGGSFIDGYSVRTQDRLTEVLESNLGEGFEVINLGVVGYGTDQSLLLLNQEGWQLQPDLVMLGVSYNDVWRNASKYFANTNRQVQKPVFVMEAGSGLTLSNVPVPRPAVSWQEHFKVYQLVRAVVKGSPALHRAAIHAGVADAPGLVWGEEFPVYRKTETPVFAKAWAMTEALLGNMKQEASARGVGFMVFYIPARIEISAEEWRDAHLPADYDLGQVAGKLGAICQADGIPFVDPSARFREAAQHSPLFYSHDTHWNAAGHHLVGKVLTEYVQSNRSGVGQ